jgi:hypothetical protein
LIDSCPLGDTAKQDVALNMNCKQIVAKRPSMCYDDKVGRLWCCGSCGAIVKPDPGIKPVLHKIIYKILNSNK